MNIGLFFGSFNPIHQGHLIIANHILNEGIVDKVWFVVSPQNPLKETKSLLNENHRLYLVDQAIEGDLRLQSSSVEFKLPKPSYTSVTLAHLSEKYPQHRFSVIMGGDSFQNLKKWKNYQYITGNYRILVYARPGFEITDTLGADVNILKAPLLEISATTIRQLISEKKSVKYLIPDVVIEAIESGGYYRK